MSLTGPSTQRPRRLVFTNMVDGAELEAQFNPTQFTEQIAANWTELSLPGASYRPLQFVNTDNLKLNLELFFLAQTPLELKAMQRARLLLIAWCKPRFVSNEVVGGGAPRLLITWPGMLSLEAVLRTVSNRHQRFNRLGQSVHYTAAISLEQISDVQVHFNAAAEDEQGWFGAEIDLRGEVE